MADARVVFGPIDDVSSAIKQDICGWWSGCVAQLCIPPEIETGTSPHIHAEAAIDPVLLRAPCIVESQVTKPDIADLDQTDKNRLDGELMMVSVFDRGTRDKKSGKKTASARDRTEDLHMTNAASIVRRFSVTRSQLRHTGSTERDAELSNYHLTTTFTITVMRSGQGHQQ